MDQWVQHHRWWMLYIYIHTHTETHTYDETILLLGVFCMEAAPSPSAWVGLTVRPRPPSLFSRQTHYDPRPTYHASPTCNLDQNSVIVPPSSELAVPLPLSSPCRRLWASWALPMSSSCCRLWLHHHLLWAHRAAISRCRVRPAPPCLLEIENRRHG
jgi:hypothetical protein